MEIPQIFCFPLTIPARLCYHNQAGCAPVAQLDRVSDSDSEGHRFESCRAYVKIPRNLARFRGIALFWNESRVCMRYMVGVHIFILVSMRMMFNFYA